MQDYSGQNEPNEEELFRMMDDAEQLAGMLHGRRWRVTTIPVQDTWPAPLVRNPLPPPVMTPHPVVPTYKPPITDAIQREKAYADAKFEQRRGGDAKLSVREREFIEEHIRSIERIANDIELMRTGSEIIDKAVTTLRLACLGFVKGSSPVGGSDAS